MRSGLALVVAVLASAAAGPARAQEAAPDRLRAASAEYDAGRRAYVTGDFEGAAAHFENAWHDAPRAESLRSAIRARRAAKQGARAATLAALARAAYPADAATLALADESLAQLAPGLHEVRILCAPACALAVDGHAPLADDAAEQRVFLEPGRHELIASWVGDRAARTRRVEVDARAGTVERLALDAPVAVALAAIGPSPRPVTVVRATRPFGPAVFVTGAVLTAAAIGVTTWSGIDTLGTPGTDVVRERCVGLGEACPEYQRGRDAQLRTNVALAVAGGLALATGVVGVFFTQWSAPGGGGVAVRGAF